MDLKALAERLLPGDYPALSYYEELYPPRDLEKGAEVTRLAPSPTGFIHLGNLFVAIANERIAHQSGGVLYLRIEDTDEKRRVEGAVEAVKNALRYFDIRFDEGAEIEGAENKYGPYYQRQRADIYRAFVKDLIVRGRAYPCFCTEEELSALRERQVAEKKITGYYGEYAKCRTLSEEEIYRNLDEGKPYVIRLKSMGDPEHKLSFHDEIKGDITVTENDQDVVILKSDGIPTYHFAHAIDDHFMRTTLVIRGEEWLASLPIHLELFDVLGFRRPRYGHNCSLMKQDGETRRKLSKRKDPELSLEFYRQEGYFARAVKVYMLTLLNSNFEEWYRKNPDAPLESFRFSASKMSKSGTLFDLDKLNDISADELARLSEEEMLCFLKEWAEEYGTDAQKACFQGRGLHEEGARPLHGHGQQEAAARTSGRLPRRWGSSRTSSLAPRRTKATASRPRTERALLDSYLKFVRPCGRRAGVVCKAQGSGGRKRLCRRDEGIQGRSLPPIRGASPTSRKCCASPSRGTRTRPTFGPSFTS